MSDKNTAEAGVDPRADKGAIEEAGRLADRLSINVELPTRKGLTRLAPDKDETQI